VTVRIAAAIAVFALAAAIAWWLERRRRTAPPTQGRAVVPQQLDRHDFPRPDAPWLVALFTSQHCESCHGLYAKAAPLESEDVAVAEIEYTENPALHRRYAIEAAPITVVADADGVTRASFVGAFDAPQLWSEVAELRQQAI
jgi:thioredoxin family protein